MSKIMKLSIKSNKQFCNQGGALPPKFSSREARTANRFKNVLGDPAGIDPPKIALKLLAALGARPKKQC